MVKYLVLFLLLGYFGVVAGLFMKACQIEQLNPVRKYVFFIPFMYVYFSGTLLFDKETPNKRALIKHLASVVDMMLLIMLCLAHVLKQRSPSNNHDVLVRKNVPKIKKELQKTVCFA